MSILNELQSRRLGLIELLSMGLELYFKNIKLFLIAYCIILVPFGIVADTLQAYINLSPLLFLLWFFLILIYGTIFAPAYQVAASIITENLLLGRKTQINRVMKTILSCLLPLICLNIRFSVNYFLRSLLLFIPGIIYAINNTYYSLAFILRDQKGKAAFAYSRAIVKGNWWRVFFFLFLIVFVVFGGLAIFQKFFSLIPIINSSPVLMIVLPDILAGFLSVGIGIGGILLFFNLDFQKGLKS
ncbi:MAG: hypothetical protein QNJ36_15855 [Calothrix sp. MO_167.B42]|nr:hypothetical protein [Calothrix sp. MO_167.B42]